MPIKIATHRLKSRREKKKKTMRTARVESNPGWVSEKKDEDEIGAKRWTSRLMQWQQQAIGVCITLFRLFVQYLMDITICDACIIVHAFTFLHSSAMHDCQSNNSASERNDHTTVMLCFRMPSETTKNGWLEEGREKKEERCWRKKNGHSCISTNSEFEILSQNFWFFLHHSRSARRLHKIECMNSLGQCIKNYLWPSIKFIGKNQFVCSSTSISTHFFLWRCCCSMYIFHWIRRLIRPQSDFWTAHIFSCEPPKQIRLATTTFYAYLFEVKSRRLSLQRLILNYCQDLLLHLYYSKRQTEFSFLIWCERIQPNLLLHCVTFRVSLRLTL